jgi:hypothetical protein
VPVVSRRDVVFVAVVVVFVVTVNSPKSSTTVDLRWWRKGPTASNG